MVAKIWGPNLEQFPTPPPVRQHINPNTCWAAALSSWLQAVRPGPPPVRPGNGNKPTYTGELQKQMEDYYTTVYSQDYLFDYFKGLGYCTDAGLRSECVGRMLADPLVRASYEKNGAQGLTPEYLREKLRLSHLWFAAGTGSSWHAVVIYSIYSGSDGLTLVMMDPMLGPGKSMPYEVFLRERVKTECHIGYVDFNHQIDGRSPYDW